MLLLFSFGIQRRRPRTLPKGVVNPHPSRPGVGGGEGARLDPSSSWGCQQFGKTRRIFPEWPLPRMPFDPRVMGRRPQTSHLPRPKAWGTGSTWHVSAGGPTTRCLQRVPQSSTSAPRLTTGGEGAGRVCVASHPSPGSQGAWHPEDVFLTICGVKYVNEKIIGKHTPAIPWGQNINSQKQIKLVIFLLLRKASTNVIFFFKKRICTVHCTRPANFNSVDKSHLHGPIISTKLGQAKNSETF